MILNYPNIKQALEEVIKNDSKEYLDFKDKLTEYIDSAIVNKDFKTNKIRKTGITEILVDYKRNDDDGIYQKYIGRFVSEVNRENVIHIYVESGVPKIGRHDPTVDTFHINILPEKNDEIIPTFEEAFNKFFNK